MLATVGRGYAIAHMRGVNLHGYAGWITWLAVHILYLTGFQNRALVLFQWAWGHASPTSLGHVSSSLKLLQPRLRPPARQRTASRRRPRPDRRHTSPQARGGSSPVASLSDGLPPLPPSPGLHR